MALWTPRGKVGPLYTLSSTVTTRPAAAYGTSVTPGNNAKGSWAQVFAAATVSRDVCGIKVRFNSGATSTAARDIIADIGVDPAGGTSYAVLLPDLLASCSAPAVGAFGAGLSYFFPVFIKAGSAIACRGSVNNATVGTFRCSISLQMMPANTANVMCGSKVVAYGIVSASSRGTTVTPGTTSDGAWTSLGTIASGDAPWFWDYGMGVNNGTITAVAYESDIGIGDAGGTNVRVVGDEKMWQGTISEQWYDNGPAYGQGQASGGETVWARSQCSGTAVTGLSMAAYGVI